MQVYSTPNIEQFEPLPAQLQVIRDIRKNFDYSKGTHELLLSGSVGSAKSLTLAHALTTHGLMYPGAKVGIGRLALPQLKATLCQKIKEHLFESGVDYYYHESTGCFDLPNESKITAVSWADGNLSKLGSMEFSCFGIEELTETKTNQPYDVILQRTNRVPHIKEPFVLSATNPDSPGHWAYKHLIMAKSPKVKVYYSNTYDNPYLPASYIDSLKERLDERMARRMIYGEWIELTTDVIYYSYERQHNFKDSAHVVDKRFPIRLCYDFNIGLGKPLSVVFAQYLPFNDTWHFFNEIIIEGQRTLDSLEESAARGLLDLGQQYIVHGDASGRHNDTRSKTSDYDIIDKFLSNYQTKSGQSLNYRIDVPRANPPVRDRHNITNGYICNSKGIRKLFVYKDAPTVDEGLRLTKLRSGGSYLEDDSDRFQHCTTAIGYAIMFEYQLRAHNGTGPTSLGSY